MSRIRRRVARLLQAGQLPLPWPPDISMAMEICQLLIDAGQLTPPAVQLAVPRTAYEYVALIDDQEKPMTDPHEMIAAISNLERELHALDWRPVEMMDEASGIPFTRWFPPVSWDARLADLNFESTDGTGADIPMTIYHLTHQPMTGACDRCGREGIPDDELFLAVRSDEYESM